jgi:hypothetical protein
MFWKTKNTIGQIGNGRVRGKEEESKKKTKQATAKQHNFDLRGDLCILRNVKNKPMFQARQVRKPQTQNNI